MRATDELQAEIVSIGTELLLGEITDTNASWIAGQLPALGIPLYRGQQVGDNRARLVATLREAWTRANLLILTGGLGPTEDDVTREAIADLLGETMEVAPDLEVELRAFFARRGRHMPATNVKQATLIPSASVLANPIGTAPGWWVEHDGRYLATMPGVPVEMRRMWREEVTPRLLRLPRGGAIVSRTLKILGIGESSVEEQLGALVRGDNPTVATYAKDDGIHVRLAARAAEQDEAWRLIAAVEARVRAIFGDSIYGIDGETLPDAIVRQLLAHDRRLVVAEAGLGSALCAALNGASPIAGMVLPQWSPVGNETEAEEMARRLVIGSQEMRISDNMLTGAVLRIGACILPHQDYAANSFWLAAALRDGEQVVTRAEPHRTDSADAPRRAVLLALQLLRERLGTT